MSAVAARLDFFHYLFAHDTGFICIASNVQGDKESFKEQYFEWPKRKDAMLDYIDRVSSSRNAWFGVNVLSVPKRLGENCIPQNLLWADLDSCSPDKLEIPPQLVIESSPRRYQAIWKLETKIDPRLATSYSRRIAYAYAHEGADKSGHDLTQLLRIPGTYNFKYSLGDTPEVKVLVQSDSLLPVVVFDTLPELHELPDWDDITGLEVPDIRKLPSAGEIIHLYRQALRQTSFPYYYGEEPDADWSRNLWILITLCIDVGMSASETFVVAKNAKCNKYERDGRPDSHLWREVLKAELQQKNLNAIIHTERPLVMPMLVEDDKVTHSIIHDYKKWATIATDATEEYHELSAAILLSALMASGLKLKTSFGTIVPNLWGLILGDTTLTRKTTAMQMATDFLADIDRDIIVATDGSAEGLLTALAARPKMTSMYYRDEITGFLESIKRKDFLAGMPETLTQLYDVPKFMTRTLRKGSISIQEPVFIFFGGGIRDKTYFLIEEEMFYSGFIPRFLVVTGYTDMDRVRRTGPPLVDAHGDMRDNLRSTFQALYNTYAQNEVQVQAGDQMFTINRETEAILTNEGWDLFGQFEEKLIASASESPFSTIALPCFQRMAFSLLKLAVLFGAARQEPDGDSKITIGTQDLNNSAYFIQRWGIHMVDLIRNSGHTKEENAVRAVMRTVQRHPGIGRSLLMQRHHLNARQMEEIAKTLEQRGVIEIVRKGRGQNFFAIGR